jgi:hypothetical protein
MDFGALLDLQTLLRKYGRGVLFYAHDGTGPDDVGDPTVWDGVSDLQLAHLGDTEGDINFVPNATVANFTLPEISGGAIYDATYVGENPQLQAPLYLADPDLLPIISPIGQAGAGHVRVRDVSERTLVLFPEDMFRDEASDPAVYRQLSFDGADFLLNNLALTAAQLTLMALSVWMWRGYFERPDLSFMGGHGDAGKNIVTVNFNVMMHPALPDGQRLYTRGAPSVVGIDIGGGS